MKAILMNTPGQPEVLQLHDIPAPSIQSEHQLLVRLYAAGINPIDTKLRQRGTFYPELMPAILGCDGAGIVEAIGTKVQRFKIGDEVYFCNGGLGGHPGNYAEYTTVDERFVAHRPTSISVGQAASAPLVLITAWEALYDRGRLQPGQTVLIHGGAGGVGHVAIQLAKLQGARVCTTVSSDAKAKFVRQLGADQVIDYHHTDFIKATLDWTQGEGVDLVLDTVGGKTFSQSFQVTRLYGDVVTLLEPDATTNWKTARNRNLRIGLELMLTPMLLGLVEEHHHQARILEQCTRLIDGSKLMIYVHHTLPLANAAEAHHLLQTGDILGKLSLLIP